MGIGRDNAFRLAELFKGRDLLNGGSILTLGKQDLDFTFGALILELHALKLLRFTGQTMVGSERQQRVIDEFTQNGRLLSSKPAEASKGHISDEFFFRFLGFDTVKSVDINDYEGADFKHDLNVPGMSETTGTYDVVYDGGTIEHVFHVPNAMKNIVDATKIGGTVLHHSPTNNHVDHGFYQFSPMFFAEYYSANHFADMDIVLLRYDYKTKLAMGTRYREDMRLVVQLDDASYGTQFIGRKTPASTGEAIPQQGKYRFSWPWANQE